MLGKTTRKSVVAIFVVPTELDVGVETLKKKLTHFNTFNLSTSRAMALVFVR